MLQGGGSGPPRWSTVGHHQQDALGSEIPLHWASGVFLAVCFSFAIFASVLLKPVLIPQGKAGDYVFF